MREVTELTPEERKALRVDLEAADRAEARRAAAAVDTMSYEELLVVAEENVDVDFDYCHECAEQDCRHRRAGRRLGAVQIARAAGEPGEIPVIPAGTARLAGDLVPSNVRVVSGITVFNGTVADVSAGDFLPVSCPLPGVLHIQEGHVEVVRKQTDPGVVVLDVVRTNVPTARPVEHTYLDDQNVTIRRPGNPLTDWKDLRP